MQCTDQEAGFLLLFDFFFYTSEYTEDPHLHCKCSASIRL